MSLEGKIFISTVSHQKAERFRSVISPLGATLIDFPMTDVRASLLTPGLMEVFSELELYHWVIFTSGHGVCHFMNFWKRLYPSTPLPGHLRFAVIGNATGRTLAHEGYRSEYTSTGNTAEDLGIELVNSGLLKNCRVLLALGNLAPDTLGKKLSGVCTFARINVYQNVKTTVIDPEIVKSIVTGDYDLVLFTSPSSVEHFAEIILPLKIFLPLKIACIGSVTASAAMKYDIPSLVTAEESTYEGLVRQIELYYKP
jgi:uroporphyrinogen-III synthase